MRSDIDSQLCFTEKLFGRPLTRSGWWAVGLEGLFVVLVIAMVQWGGAAGWGVNVRANALAGATGVAGFAAGAASAVAIFRHGERSLMLIAILVLSVLLLIFSAALLA